jgi:hypothetical protein
MDINQFKQYIEENKDLFKPELLNTLNGRIANNELTPELIKYMVSEIEKVKKVKQGTDNMVRRGSEIYKQGAEDANKMIHEAKSFHQMIVKKKESSEHDKETEEAENLLSNL